MKKTAKLVGKIVSCAVMAIVLVALIVGTTIAYSFKDVVTSFLAGLGSDFSEATDELKNGDALCVQIAEESITLLRNENVSDGKPALPLRSNVNEVSVFGYGGTDKGFLTKGVGSGSSTIEPQKSISLLQGISGYVRDFDIDEEKYIVDGNVDEAKLAAAKEEFAETLTKYQVNQKIKEIYEDFANSKNNARDTQDVLIINDDYTKKNVYKLDEPSVDEFTDGIMRNAATSSNGVALFVISRDGGENLGEMPTSQIVGGKTDDSRTYLEITTQEEEMLKLIKKYYDTTIVILNTTNTVHMGFLDNEELGIDACLYVGLLGQSGTRAIPEILSGKINPSGKYTDIVTRDSKVAAQFDPTFNNFTTGNGGIRYVEDIYYGYKWFETAAADNFTKKDGTQFNYNNVVAYPFGHGLSYTTFDKQLESLYYYDGTTKVELNNSLDNVPSVSTPIYADVKVTNTGNAGGKDVVELYYTPQYYKGGIEKAAVNLLAFEKTKLLEVREETTVTLSFTLFDMASYDAYDKNGNKFWGYELESGSYDIKLMENSHKELSKVTLELSAPHAKKIDKDPTTGNDIANRLTGKRDSWDASYNGTAYAGCGSDGYEAGVAEDWLSRGDFAETFPEGRAAMQPNNSVVNATAQFTNTAPYENIDLTFKTETVKDEALYLWTKEDGSKATLNDLNGKGEAIVPNYELFAQLANYGNKELWNQLLDQMSLTEIKHLVEWGGFKRIATESVGLRRLYDNDGPAGFNGESLGDHTGKWTAYTSEALMGCSWNNNLAFLLGRAMGAEANATSINGWYAPGVNLHRSSYNARNFEYYSEDGVLSGHFAANVIAGAKTNGLNCYLKHFAVSELGNNPVDVTTWVTEQNLRENYLKPFEIAVKGVDVELIPVDEEGNELTENAKTIHVGANSLMTAFNRVGASWAGANYGMNVQILRGEWGFNGTLLTDWTSTNWGNGHENLGSMRVEQGIRAGNDLWLEPFETNRSLDVNDPIDAYAGRNCVKNILYTVADTYNTYNIVKQSGAQLDKYQTNLSDKFRNQNAWWIPTLITIDVVLGIGFVVGGLFIWGVPQKLIGKIKKSDSASAE